MMATDRLAELIKLRFDRLQHSLPDRLVGVRPQSAHHMVHPQHLRQTESIAVFKHVTRGESLYKVAPAFVHCETSIK